MAINKKLIHFKNKENFNTEVANGNILDNSIVFIQDSKEISTHGTVYKTVNWSVLENPELYEWVDLGLPSGLKWATCNVGATKPEESGLFFQWGDTLGYKVTLGELQNESQGLYSIESMEPEMKQFAQDFSDYKFYNSENGGVMPAEVEPDQSSPFTKYNGLDGLTTLELSDEAANTDYSKMRIPTKEECMELLTGTTSAWTDNYNGTNVNGCVFTSKVDETKSIFVPAAGAVYDGVAFFVGLGGGFWSSSLYESVVERAYNPNFGSRGGGVEDVNRFFGFPVRGVLIN